MLRNATDNTRTAETTPISNIEITVAHESDLDGILELQAANQIGKGGMLSASFSRSQLQRITKDMPLLVARRDRRIVGFLVCSTPGAVADIPIVLATLDSYPTRTPDAYVYGPICIDARERGRGLARLLSDELKRLTPGREGVLFIRRDNDASIQAHRKMGMKEVSSFSFGGMDHVVLSYVG